MIDLRYILEQPEVVAANNKKRFVDIDLSSSQSLSHERKSLLEQIQDKREQGNVIAGKIPQASEGERQTFIEQGRTLKESVKELEATLQGVEEQLDVELRKYPNLLREDVPEGADDSGNEVMRSFGEIPTFDFEPKDHLDLGESLGMIDSERAAKVSGARFTYLKGDAVLLEFALVQYALSLLIKEGFIPIVPPHMIFSKAMGAMGYLEHGGEEEIYHLKNDDLVLIGTSEQAIGPMHMDEILEEKQLPLRYMGISPCYRREAGSYGKDTRGILRVHQFDKIEMFSFTTPENSDQEHEVLLSMQEKLMQGLLLPYRVVKLCAGDTGRPSARTYDIETWMPTQGTYRETHSTSNTTDYQTRRLNTRIRREGKNVFAHALNGTAFAIGRTLIAIMENNQQADGSIRVPEVLQPWVGKDFIRSTK
ncbi:serine--tRNA ligase [Candidatus Uhrbacteria bacterium RIFOXYA2_FULL_40_9]|nr:MAG: serine--tRNA ligase [Candidatus Uhrbacteria bacterium RIFOXYA2_FULL_40_9]OGL97318.1 MAG: serine--tRNA ligase [Candidatus Uhrbacteria bacterium RIFOXYB2_FULL_41_18]HBK35277.1 serine--tRNA ligase [Candidatus Uhrbacteria bacterium]HCB55476.1 serine--tRNA ligase [Candidatus Uhrbacteria bacterium]